MMTLEMVTFLLLVMTAAMTCRMYLKAKKADAALANARKQNAALEAKMNKMENDKGVTRNTTMELATLITRMENNLFLMRNGEPLRMKLFQAVRKMKSILNATKDAGDTSQELAAEIANMESDLNDMGRNEACRKNLSRAVQGMKASLQNEGFEMIDLIGQSYSDKMDASVVFIHDQSLPVGSFMIISVQKPILLYKGDRLQSGHVTVGENLPGTRA